MTLDTTTFDAPRRESETRADFYFFVTPSDGTRVKPITTIGSVSVSQ